MTTKNKTRTKDLSHISPELRPLARLVSRLKLDPDPVRDHTTLDLEAQERSLLQYGQQKTIVLYSDGTTVMCGNGTLQAAVKLGWKWIATSKSDLTPALARAYAMDDNRIAELSTWNMDNVRDHLQELLKSDVRVTGWTEKEVSALLIGWQVGGGVGGGQTNQLTQEFQVLVMCTDEMQQRILIERFEKEGLSCRARLRVPD